MTAIQRKATISATLLALAVCAAAVAIYLFRAKAPPTELTQFDLSRPAGKVNFEFSLVERTVRAQLRYPNSAKFGPMLAYRFQHLNGRSGTAVCGSVSAKNETGAYDDPKEFVFISDPVSAVIDPSTPDPRFLNVWKDYCTDRR